MGDMNDYYMALALDNGEWFPPGGHGYYRPQNGEGLPTFKTCNRCGKGGLIWRVNDVGVWRLYEDRRVHPGNYKPPHVCGPDPSTDFD